MTSKLDRTACDHRHTDKQADISVGYMEDTGRFIADVKIACACGEPFRFLGLKAGISWSEPLVSIDSLELHAPIEPQGTPRLMSHARFEMPPMPVKKETESCASSTGFGRWRRVGSDEQHISTRLD